jgi:hypothetical protein
VIIAVFRVANVWQLSTTLSPWALQLVLYSGVLLGTWLVAQLSFTYLEMPFLRLKNLWFSHDQEKVA